MLIKRKGVKKQDIDLPMTKIPGDAYFKTSALSYVMNGLMDEKGPVESGERPTVAAVHLSFRLCMANVLISACQKVSGSEKKPFVKKIVPSVTRSIGVCNLFFIQIIRFLHLELNSWDAPSLGLLLNHLSSLGD